MITPLISIIVPVYNAEKYLRQCLDSVVAQSYTNWECLLVDDGSKDLSCSICDEYELKDQRFKAIHKQNQGVSHSRNYGIEHATGDWITFLDSDDYISESYLSDFILSGNYDLISCGQQNFGFSTNSICWVEKKAIDVKRIPRDFINQKKHPANNRYLFCWGHLFRSAIIKDANLRFDEYLRVGEDTNFVLEYVSRCSTIVQLPVCNINYRTFNIPFFKKYCMDFDEFIRHAESIYIVGEHFQSNCGIGELDIIQHNVNVYYECYISFLKSCKRWDDFIANLHSCDNLARYVRIQDLIHPKRKKLIHITKSLGYVGYLFFALNSRLIK